MNRFLAFVLLLAPLCAVAQLPVSQRTTNGTSYGETLVNPHGIPTYDTNTIFITEPMPVVGYAPAVNTVDVSSTYTNASGFYTSSLGANGVVLYLTNDVVFQGVIDATGSGVVFRCATNNFPQGPWYPTAVWVDAGGSANNRLVGSYASTPSATNALTANYAARVSPVTRNATIKGCLPIFSIIISTNSDMDALALTNAVNFLVSNQLVGVVDVIEQDSWTGQRNASGDLTFSTSLFPGWTVTSFSDYLHTNGFKAGLHLDYGNYDPTLLAASRNGSQGYYFQDSTNLVSHGIDYVLIDSTRPPSPGEKAKEDLMVDLIENLHKAGVRYGHPVHVFGAFSGSWPYAFSNWMSYADTWGVGSDAAVVGEELKWVNQSLGYTGSGKGPAFAVASFNNTNDARQVLALVSIVPVMNLNTITNSLTANVIPLVKTNTWRSIWRDQGGSGWLITSNAAYLVWARGLANGDTAVAIINQSNGVSSVTVNNTTLGYNTNQSILWKEVFVGTNATVTGGMTTPVRPSDGSLWRLTPQ